MPDSLGRYYVYEMENRVRRILDTYSLTLDQYGNETPILTDFNVSNQDIDIALNESLTALYTEAIVAHEDIFVQTFFMDIIEGQLRYNFPPGMLQLRWMRWKNNNLFPLTSTIPGNPVATNGARPFDYTPMYEVFDPNDIAMSVGYYRGPTWQRVGDGFMLGDFPRENNPAGIMIQGVLLPQQFPITTAAMWAPPGVGNTAVIQGPLPRVAQETIIYDAAMKLGDAKDKDVPPTVATLRTEWHERFMVTAQNIENKPSINMVSGRLIGVDYAGRGLSTWRGGNLQWS
jgi:hypothetical protein